MADPTVKLHNIVKNIGKLYKFRYEITLIPQMTPKVSRGRSNWVIFVSAHAEMKMA